MFYTLLIWQEIQNITRVFLWSYSEYIWLDLLSFFLAIFTYILAILFYAALLGRKRSNTTKKITLLFLLFGIAYLCFYVIPMLIEFPIFSQNYTFPFYLDVYKRQVTALSMYSVFPMPQLEWNQHTMKYAMCFFPFVGIVVGAFVYLWVWICGFFSLNTALAAVVLALLPVLLSGGIHLDGLIDTSDALSSHQPAERKLEILKMCIRDRT